MVSLVECLKLRRFKLFNYIAALLIGTVVALVTCGGGNSFGECKHGVFQARDYFGPSGQLAGSYWLSEGCPFDFGYQQLQKRARGSNGNGLSKFGLRLCQSSGLYRLPRYRP